MTLHGVHDFLVRHRWAVVSSLAADGAPQSAVVGVIVSDRFEFLFDTLASSRKMANILRDPRASLVVGWDEAQTVQVDGLADFPAERDLERLQTRYFAAFPDGRDRLAKSSGLVYVRVRPTWMRYSDFRPALPRITEWGPAELPAIAGFER
jgi:hypothetical protein